MARHKIATTADLPEDGSRVLAEVDGLEIAVFRVDGEYYALANYCVHQGGPLCEGKLTGKMVVDDEYRWEYDDDAHCVVCPWHEWKFDVRTGAHVLDERYVTPTFDVEVEGEDVYVVR